MNTKMGERVTIRHRGKKNIKNQRTGQIRRNTHKKTVHWRESQIKTYNPDSPAINHPKIQTAGTIHNLNTLNFYPSQLSTPSPQFNSYTHSFNNPLNNSYNLGRPQHLPHTQAQLYNQPFYPTQQSSLPQINPFTNHQGTLSKRNPVSNP
jgi:hypothetical protein